MVHNLEYFVKVKGEVKVREERVNVHLGQTCNFFLMSKSVHNEIQKFAVWG